MITVLALSTHQHFNFFQQINFDFAKSPKVNCSRKIIPYAELPVWRGALGQGNGLLVVTNGCFDLLHPGHLHLLETARSLGSALLVGVTGDEAVRKLKGKNRPVILEKDRVLMLAGLEAVSFVCLFPEVNAVAFLEKSRPDIYVKGGDYTIDTINQTERKLLENMGVKIQILPMLEHRSSSALLSRILASRDSA
jgi:D-glycero-beta-D-manno-heptose 1-phosphate adenylyltransferase